MALNVSAAIFGNIPIDTTCFTYVLYFRSMADSLEPTSNPATITSTYVYANIAAICGSGRVSLIGITVMFYRSAAISSSAHSVRFLVQMARAAKLNPFTCLRVQILDRVEAIHLVVLLTSL
jgi:hypothetical protein